MPVPPGVSGGGTTPPVTTGPEQDIGEVLATVNGMKVGSIDFQSAASRVSPADGEALSQEERLEVLNELIDEKLLYQEALRQGLDKDPKVQKASEDLEATKVRRAKREI